MKTILLVESDVGFLFWFGEGLAQAGYAVIPAKSVPDAEALLGESQIAVDLLIVNPALPDTAGFVETLRSLNHRLKVVAVTDNQAEPGQIPDVEFRFQKPERTDESTRQELIAQIERVSPLAAN